MNCLVGIALALIVVANLASSTSADDCTYLAGNWAGTQLWGKYKTNIYKYLQQQKSLKFL